jgi:hypothetical protein
MRHGVHRTRATVATTESPASEPEPQEVTTAEDLDNVVYAPGAVELHNVRYTCWTSIITRRDKMYDDELPFDDEVDVRAAEECYSPCKMIQSASQQQITERKGT